VRKQKPKTSHQNNKKGLIFVISGPSGSGKTTLVARLIRDKDLRQRLAKSVSVTTRPRRLKEKEGKDYFFLSPKRFRQQRQAKKILEWTRYLGHYYATPREFTEAQLAAGKSIMLSLDLKGASRLKRLYPGQAITIFILPPSLGVLRDRIEKRSPETKKTEIRRRLKLAEGEVLAAQEYDYCLVNQDLQNTFDRLKEIMLKEMESVR
jgi:guanylate kinase